MSIQTLGAISLVDGQKDLSTNSQEDDQLELLKLEGAEELLREWSCNASGADLSKTYVEEIELSTNVKRHLYDDLQDLASVIDHSRVNEGFLSSALNDFKVLCKELQIPENVSQEFLDSKYFENVCLDLKKVCAEIDLLTLSEIFIHMIENPKETDQLKELPEIQHLFDGFFCKYLEVVKGFTNWIIRNPNGQDWDSKRSQIRSKIFATKSITRRKCKYMAFLFCFCLLNVHGSKRYDDHFQDFQKAVSKLNEGLFKVDKPVFVMCFKPVSIGSDRDMVFFHKAILERYFKMLKNISATHNVKVMMMQNSIDAASYLEKLKEEHPLAKVTDVVLLSHGSTKGLDFSKADDTGAEMDLKKYLEPDANLYLCACSTANEATQTDSFARVISRKHPGVSVFAVEEVVRDFFVQFPTKDAKPFVRFGVYTDADNSRRTNRFPTVFINGDIVSC